MLVLAIAFGPFVVVVVVALLARRRDVAVRRSGADDRPSPAPAPEQRSRESDAP
ncbi:MAG: hypothetical protein WB441_05635 [Nocardioidaceae bacterium]